MNTWGVTLVSQVLMVRTVSQGLMVWMVTQVQEVNALSTKIFHSKQSTM